MNFWDCLNGRQELGFVDGLLGEQDWKTGGTERASSNPSPTDESGEGSAGVQSTAVSGPGS